MSDRSHQLVAIELGDAPSAWRAAGFAVDERGRLRLGATEVRLTGDGGDPAWSIDGVVGPIDGLPVAGADVDVGGEPPAASATASASSSSAPSSASVSRSSIGAAPTAVHPNGISRIDHVVISTDDGDRTVAAFRAAGLPPRRVREVSDGPRPMRQTFCWAGDVIIEIVGPLTAPADSLAGTLAGTTWFGLALVADDLDTTATRLGALLGTPRDAVQSGRRIAGLRHRDVGISLPVAVMSPHR